MGVREREQQHPVRMEGGKREPEGDRKCPISTQCQYKHTAEGIAQAYDVRGNSGCLPEQVKHGGEKQLVVDGNAHVSRLVEGRGDRPDGGPQGATPAQEQKLSCGRSKDRGNLKSSGLNSANVFSWFWFCVNCHPRLI